MHDGRRAPVTRRFLALAASACLMLIGLTACLFAPVIDGSSRPTYLRTVPATDEEVGEWTDDSGDGSDAVPSPSRGDGSSPPGSTHHPVTPPGTSGDTSSDTGSGTSR